MFRVSLKLPVIMLSIGIAASGCSNTDAAVGEKSGKLNVEKTTSRFSDIPMPGKSDIDMDRTLVFGGGETWSGRLAISSSHNANDVFDFFKQELPGYGWREIASIRSTVSVLTYSRENRIATIQIKSTTLGGSDVTLTVSPRDDKAAQEMPGNYGGSGGASFPGRGGAPVMQAPMPVIQ